MRNASGQQGKTIRVKNERQWKAHGEHIRHIFFITCVNRKSYVVVIENNGKEMYKKSVLHVHSFFCCYLVY